MDEKSKRSENLNSNQILQCLTNNGYIAYKVGGCVRDLLLSKYYNIPNNTLDEDICTNATPDQVLQLFPEVNSKLQGKQFGVIVINGIEIATFRGDTYTIPGKPQVHYVTSVIEDAARRDLTINAIYQDMTGNIIDPVNGVEDLKIGIIRMVNNPYDRFVEDPARVLRVITFAARFNNLGFKIHKDTESIILQYGKDFVKSLPVERLQKEIVKMLNYKVLHIGMNFLQKYGLLEVIFPELQHLVNLPQNPNYHHWDAWKHTLGVIQQIEKINTDHTMILATLYHDCAKGLPSVRTIHPMTGQLQDIGHETKGTPIAQQGILRLGFGRDIANKVSLLVKYHMTNNTTPKSILRKLNEISKYFNNKEDLKIFIKQLFELMECDAKSFSPNFSIKRLEEINKIKLIFMKILDTIPFYPKDIGINGNNAVQLGYQGEEIADWLTNQVRIAQSAKMKEVSK